MATDETSPVPGEAMELIATLVSQNARDAAYTTNALLDGYRADRERAEATLRCIRARIYDMVTGDFMPTSAAIQRALYPTDAEIDAWRSEP